MTAIEPPRPRKDLRQIEQLGRTRVDDYGWMKDANWRDVLRDPARVDPEIRAHLEAENAYLKSTLVVTEALRARIFEEMKGRLKADESSLPTADGAFEYFSRYEAGAQHPRHVRRPRGSDHEEELLLDEEAEAAGKAYYSVDAAAHSPDHLLYAWAEDDQGSEYHRIFIKDLLSGQRLAGGPESASGSFAFSPDSQWLFWVWRDENARPARIFRRPARGGDDVLVYEEADDGMFLGVGVTADDGYIVIGVQNQETSEEWIIPAADPTAAARVVEPRQVGLRYDVDHWSDRWVIRTNADDAVDFKVLTSDAELPARSTWREWVRHRPGVLVAGLALFRDHIVRHERQDACDRLVVMAREGDEHVIAFSEAAYALTLSGGYEYDTSLTRFVYQSPTTPRQWFDYDMQSRTRTLRKTQEVPSGHDPAHYEVRRLWAPAPDGETVPVTVLMRRGAVLDGSAPLMLHGYGAYGFPQTATFSTQVLSLVDRGWIWADAHVRGGSDKGWGWFLDGRKFNKKNSFTDFIACAEHLVGEGYTRVGRLVASGASAGGLLVGAAVNMRPDLFGGVIATVPFVDVLNTMSDTDLPLTPPEWPEWGNPLEDPDAYDYIASYCPYTNIGPKPYPAILARAGLSDPRVTWWEPEKWVARLRDRTTGDRPILLSTNLEAGHGGASGRFEHLKEVAQDYAFAVWAVTGETGL